MPSTFTLPQKYKEITDAGRETLIKTLGWAVIRQSVYEVCRGKNLRDVTEMLTRRRLALLNAALLTWTLDSDSWEDLLNQAGAAIHQGKLPKAERWTAQWLLGLTDKARQNVLRDQKTNLDTYIAQYKQALVDITQESIETFGPLTGNLQLGQKIQDIDWSFFLFLLSAVGAQTLTIRGSEKSLYGKFFEPLVLGTLLTCLGFRFVSDPQSIPPNPHGIFWLSSREEKGESDATLIYRPGKGVRFDIGFIGRGNPEISLDKVSRFERQAKISSQSYDVLTLILVDRIGKNSHIQERAQDIGGYIIQMSMGYWPRTVAQTLQHELGFDHPILKKDDAELEQYLKECINKAPLAAFLHQSQDDAKS